MHKIGFMFGAGAEISYGLPTGGDFALGIFRQDPTQSKGKFKEQRDAIDPLSAYTEWLPDDYSTRSISAFGKKVYEDIMRGTIEQNRENIISRLNHLDNMAVDVVTNIQQSRGIDVDNSFYHIIGREVSNTHLDKEISFIDEFRDGNDLFKSKYFSALMLANKTIKATNRSLSNDLTKIVVAILQMQIGALGEKLARRINESIFDKKPDEYDILDDLGDIIRLDYQSAGMVGFEYLLEMQEPDVTSDEGIILLFAQKLIERIYACVIDYKALIDSNWMYLYHPDKEWTKFCKISIFLHTVQEYMDQKYRDLPDSRDGYYDDIAHAIASGRLELSGVGTSNYTPLIRRLSVEDEQITYLNGSTDMWYDPYYNRIGSYEQLAMEKHFIVPLMFTQSGTKPMISIEMSSQYVNYFNRLSEADMICIIGFGFNPDDEHINGIFRELIDRKDKCITVVSKSSKTTQDVKREISSKLKIKNKDNLSVVLVDDNRKRNGLSWIDSVLSEADI